MKNLKRRQRCQKCHEYVYRFHCGNIVDWSHNPNHLGATSCQTQTFRLAPARAA